jgi:hypothetical protein
LTKVLVKDPKYPAAGVIPFDFWKRVRAALVAGPNLLISCPGEPLPVVVTIKPWVLR